MSLAADLEARFPSPSGLGKHPACSRCGDFHEWLIASHRAREGEAPPGPLHEVPTWLGSHFAWGGSRWPLYFCDLLDADSVDCGVFAALASEVLRAVEVPHWRVQMIVAATPQETTRWRALWEAAACDDRWILSSSMVYHEGIAVSADTDALIYDTTDMCVVDPWSPNPIGRLRAAKLTASEARSLDWHNEVIASMDSERPLEQRPTVPAFEPDGLRPGIWHEPVGRGAWAPLR